ncbi:MAG: hypothetical protein ACREE1_09595 [Stellaceae bacterium]
MSEADQTVLTARVVQLERRLRRMLIVTLALVFMLGLIVVIFVAIGAGEPLPSLGDRLLLGLLQHSVVEARGFEVVGQNGKVRAALRISPDDQVSLDLYGAHGHLRGQFSAGEGEVNLGLYYAQGKLGADLSIADLGILAPGQAALALYGARGIERTEYGIYADGAPYLLLYDAQKVKRSEFTLGQDGSPQLVLYGHGFPIPPINGFRFAGTPGLPRLALGSTELTNKLVGGNSRTPVSSITAFDTKGNVIGRWP